MTHSLATPQVLQTAACAAADDGAAAAADGPQQQAALPRRSALAAALAAVAAPWLATSPALAVSALSAPVGISLVYGTLSSLWASARCMGSIKPARDVQQSHPRRWLASRHSHRAHFQPPAAWSPSLRHTLWGSRAGQRCCQVRAGQVREEEEAGAPGLVRDPTLPFFVLLHRLFGRPCLLPLCVQRRRLGHLNSGTELVAVVPCSLFPMLALRPPVQMGRFRAPSGRSGCVLHWFCSAVPIVQCTAVAGNVHSPAIC